MITTVMLALSSASCVFDKYEEDVAMDNSIDTRQLIIRMKTVGAAHASETSGPVESVKSLRVIIISENGKLEVNQKITDAVAGKDAYNFGYTYITQISSGIKKVYLIANEESVGRVSITDPSGIPSNINTNSLTSYLDYFTHDAEELGEIMEKVLNRLYFKPDYGKAVEGDKIYLPYSSCYTLDVADNSRVEPVMYLVPVATKLDITFVNYREDTAIVDDVLIGALHNYNYLNAQLADIEKYRTFENNTNIWWIDWLRACAEATQEAGGDIAINKKWGWIYQYMMPAPSEQLVYQSLHTSSDLWRIPGLVDKANPSRLSVGPFYLPESKNIVDRIYPDESDPEEEDPNTQTYFLDFKVHNEGVDEVTLLEGYMLGDVKALFRATHVIVTVGMYENEVQIYAEIAPWEKKLFLGYVQEDDD